MLFMCPRASSSCEKVRASPFFMKDHGVKVNSDCVALPAATSLAVKFKDNSQSGTNNRRTFDDAKRPKIEKVEHDSAILVALDISDMSRAKAAELSSPGSSTINTSGAKWA